MGGRRDAVRARRASGRQVPEDVSSVGIDDMPLLIIYILGQRFFVESTTSSGVKG